MHQKEGAVCGGIPEGSLTKGCCLYAQGKTSQSQTGHIFYRIQWPHRAGDFGILIHLRGDTSIILKYSFETTGRSHLKTMDHITW